MEPDLLKAFLPAIGGALALLGGIFTFVSGRLRDAVDDDAKSRVLTTTWVWTATVLWLAACVVGTMTSFRLVAIPLYAIAFGIHWRLYVASSGSPTRQGTALFATLAAVTAASILFVLFAHLFDRLTELQSRQIDLLTNTIELLRKGAK